MMVFRIYLAFLAGYGSIQAAEARTISQTFAFEFAKPTACDPIEPCVPWAAELVTLERERFPIIPQKVIRVALRPDEAVDAIEVNFTDDETMDLELPVATRSQPYSRSRDPRASVPRYRGQLYPTVRYSIETQMYRGIPVVTIRLFPLQVEDGDQLRFSRSVEFNLTTKQVAVASQFRNQLRDLASVNRTVDTQLAPMGPLRDDRVGYLIVGPRAILAGNSMEFAAYLNLKDSQGYRVHLANLEDIPGGKSAEAIRSFIKTRHSEDGIDYVLLVGDKATLPWRSIRSGVGGSGDPIPSDQYYACLDGDFSSTASYDWACEVSVGRVGVSKLGDFNTWLVKTLRLEEASANAFTASVLQFGEKMDSQTLGGWVLDYLETGSGRTVVTEGFGQSVSLHKLYETFSKTYSGAEFAEQLGNGGFYIVNHLGHANNNYVFRMDQSAIPTLPDVPGFYYSQGCYPNNPDVDNWTINAVRVGGSGPAAMISNTRYGWYRPGKGNEGPSNLLHRVFWSVKIKDGVETIGAMNHRAKELAVAADSSALMRYVALESNLIGDPTLDLSLEGAR